MNSGLRRIAAVTGTVLVASMTVGVAPAQAEGRTIVVDATSYSPGSEDPICTDAAADCTFELALGEADPGDTIVFDSGIDALHPIGTLEVVEDGVTIEGGGVELSPGDVYFDGDEVLGIYADNVTVRNLVIDGWEGLTGVAVRADHSGNTISRTAVFDNSRNIVLETDGEVPGNEGQPAPEVGTPGENGVPVSVPTFEVSAASFSPATTYDVEVFRCDPEDQDNNGIAYLGHTAGVAQGTTTLVNVGAIGATDQFSATATDEQTGDTSEFSGCSGASGENFPAPADNADCRPGSTCIATPPDGLAEHFSVTASGGKTPANLVAELNGGEAPECGLPTDSDLELSPDWVKFGFEPPSAGATWAKQVAIRSLDGVSEEEATAELADTQVCFTAPYAFATRDGFPALAGGPEGLSDFYGILPDCAAGRPGAQPENPYGPFGPFGPYEGFGAYGPFGPYGPGTGTAPTPPPPSGSSGPCVTGRQVVPGETVGSFVTQITFRVPAGEQDPQGRSARKKKRH